MSRTDAPRQLERVLAMIPWLATHRDVAKHAVADRFRITREQLEGDLALIMMVGVPPYSPGDYINVTYDGDTIDLWLAPYFTRPLQLTAGEGLALLAGGRALLAVDGSDPDGPLATALTTAASRARRRRGERRAAVTAPPGRRARRRDCRATHRDRVLDRGTRSPHDPPDRPGPSVLRVRRVVHGCPLLAPG